MTTATDSIDFSMHQQVGIKTRRKATIFRKITTWPLHTFMVISLLVIGCDDSHLGKGSTEPPAPLPEAFELSGGPVTKFKKSCSRCHVQRGLFR